MGRSFMKKSPIKHISLEELRKLSTKDRRSTISKSSLKKYKSGFKSFANFCILFSLEFNPSVQNLCDYVSFASRSISPRSVRAYLVGIRHIFKLEFPSVHCFTLHQDVKDTMKSCMKEWSKLVVRKNPLSLKQIESVVSHSSGSHDDRLFLALLGIGFGGLHRLGEMTVPDSKDLFNAKKIILRSSLQFSTCGNFVQYHLPYSKCDSTFVGAPIIIQSFVNTTGCPVKLLKSYLRSRDKLFIASQELFITSSGSPPSRKWFLERFHQHFDKTFSGHSLRSGGATALAQAGATMDYIKSAGRWSSEAFLIYVRGHVALRLPENQNHVIGSTAHVGSNVSFV
jgi:hypothetical protein